MTGKFLDDNNWKKEERDVRGGNSVKDGGSRH